MQLELQKRQKEKKRGGMKNSWSQVTASKFFELGMVPGEGGGGGTWVQFCWVCAEPLPHYSLFCGQL